MRKQMFAVAVALCAAVSVADEQDEKFMSRTGGWLDRPQNGRVVRIVNRQARIGDETIEWFAGNARTMLSLPVEIVKCEAGKCCADASSDDRVGLKVVIADDAQSPLKMFAAPDDRLVRVNVAALAADGATGEKLDVRARKELWRGLVYGLGGGNNEFPGCLMVPATTLQELDALKARMPCPAPFNAMMSTARKIGIGQAGRVTYRQACREGWAPEPTNDYQKVIWNEVHAAPSKPLKIEFDKKRGK